ncbi:MAG: hypothetical protein CL398_02340 [Acidiferrobacteraceae bacterium]|nr:hypothetical protein [Acidiferrobacteraceae bacterium]
MNADTSDSKKRLFSVVSTIALVFSIFAIIAAGYSLYLTTSQNQTETILTVSRFDALENQFEALRSSQLEAVNLDSETQRQLLERHKGLEDQFQELNKTYTSDVLRLEKKQIDIEGSLGKELEVLLALIESTRRLVDQDTKDWTMEEILQILRLANERLILVGDVEIAVQAMRLAQKRLAELADPALLVVRRQLAEDIASLSQIVTPDIDSIVLQLTALIHKVKELPLATDVSFTITDNANNESLNATTNNFDQGENSTLHDLGSSIIADLSSLVRIRDITETQLPKLTADQRFLVYESLRAPLNSAQFSLVRGLSKSYKDSLKRVELALIQSFDQSAAEVKAFRTNINNLSTIDLIDSYPDASKALVLLQNIVKQRRKVE